MEREPYLAQTPMRRIFSPPALYGALAINAGLACVAAAASFRLPSFVTFFLVCLPFVLAFVLVPTFALKGRYAAPPGIRRAAFWCIVPLFVAGVLVEMGVRQMALLAQGRVVAGITVDEAPRHRDAVAFQFNAARGVSELAGNSVDQHGKTIDTWYVIPLVGTNWERNQPVAVWALSLDSVPPELAAGQFLAGVIPDSPSVEGAAGKAVADAVARHQLNSHPQAVILRMDKSLEQIRNTGNGLLIIALVGINLAWFAAVAVAKE